MAVLFIWLNQINHINQINQIDQTNQTVRACTSMGSNLLGRVIGVNRLKRGGCLFEGIVQRETEVYIIFTRCERSGLASWGVIPKTSCGKRRHYRRSLFGLSRVFG